MSITTIKSRNIITPSGRVDGYLVMNGEKIENITRDLGQQYPGLLIDVGEDFVVPGFIDLHIHGAGGYDPLSGPDDLLQMSRFLAENGTTSFFPTTTVMPIDQLLSSIKGMVQGIEEKALSGANILGIHLEGPFLNPQQKGAMPREHFLRPSLEIMKELEKAAAGHLQRVTMAPELPGSLDVMAYLKGKNCGIAGGHTAATYEETLIGIEAGITIANHMFNAMTGFHHREPGAAGAYLLSKKVICELIGDFIHIHPQVLEWVIGIKGTNGTYFISDAVTAAGLQPGSYSFLDREITVDEDGKSFLAHGILAGSSFLLKHTFQNVVKRLGFSIEEAIELTAVTPAKVAQVFHHKGSLEAGKDADILILDPAYEVKKTYVQGRPIRV